MSRETGDAHESGDAVEHGGAPRRSRVGFIIAWTLIVVIASTILIVGGFLVQRQRAVETLEQAGVYIETEAVGPQWLIDKAGLSYARYANRITRLDVIESSGFGDAELAALATLDADVQRLYLRDAPVTDRGVRHLRALGALRSLSLSHTSITDEGARHLGGMDLVELYLAKTDVGDPALAALSGVTSLKSLGLSYTRVTDAGLAHLSDMQDLAYLDLNHTDVTDAGLDHLRGLKNLKVVYVLNTDVTKAGVARLREAVPDAFVGASPKAE